MSVLYFGGAELQDFSEVASIVNSPSIDTSTKATGEASYKLPDPAVVGSQASIRYLSGLSLDFLYARFRFRISINDPPTANGVRAADLFSFATSGGSSRVKMCLNSVSDGTYTLQVLGSSETTFGDAVAINEDQWYLVELYGKPHTSTGEITWKLDGSTVYSATGLNTGGVGPIGVVDSWAPGGGKFDTWIDDVMIDDAAFPGAGQCILRKVTTGSPTYDAFTKAGAGAISAEWADVPFSATNEAHSTAASQAQTALVADVGAGTDPIGSGDTINACKVAAILKKTGSSSPTTQTRAPTSDVSFTGTWTGAPRWSSVNDHPDSGNPISSGITHGTATAGEGLFGFTAFTVPAGSTDISVQVIYYDFKNGSQGCNLRARIRCNDATGRDAPGGTHNPGNGNANIALRTDDYGANNPKTGVAWTVDDINGVGTNGLTAFGVISTDANPSITISSIMLQVTYTPPGDGTYKIRRRVNSSDTDTAKTLTTADAYYDDGPWTATFAHLQGMEMGVFRDSGGAIDVQAEDVYLLVDYTPDAAPPETAATRTHHFTLLGVGS